MDKNEIITDRKIKVIAYCRYSSTGQNPISIEIQKQSIHKYCEDENIEIIKYFIDEAKTGTNTKREGYQNMIKYIQDNEYSYDGIIVDQLDRINRDEINYYALKGTLQFCGKKMISVKENIDDTPEGKLLEAITCAVAAYLARIIARRATQGLKQKAKIAGHCGGLPPLGYTQDKYGHLIVKEDDANAVKLIFQWYAEGLGYESIAGRLNEKGFLTQRDGCFRKGSIRDILTNEKYLGIYVYNKAEEKKNGKRNSHRQKDEAEIIKIPNNHQAIISQELFQRVQDIMGQKEKKSNIRKENYVLTRLIHCRGCGRAMTGTVSYNGEGKKYSVYKCPGKGVKSCDTKPINRYYLEEFIIRTLKAHILERIDLIELTKRINEELQNSSEERENLDRYRKNLKTVTTQCNRLYNTLPKIENDKVRTRISADLTRLENDGEEIRTNINYLEEILSKEIAVAEVKSVMANFVNYMLSSKDDVAKEFLRSYVKDILVDNYSVEVTFHDNVCCNDSGNIQPA